MGCESTNISPELGGKIPIKISRNVDFPDPLGPTIAILSPISIEAEKSLKVLTLFLYSKFIFLNERFFCIFKFNE